MSFDKYTQMYLFFSSKALMTDVTKLRNKFLSLYMKTEKPALTAIKSAEKYGSLSLPEMAIDYYWRSEAFLDIPTVTKSIEDGEATQSGLTDESKRLCEYANAFLSLPNVDCYVQFLTDMNTTISQSLIKPFDDAHTLSVLKMFEKHLHDYASTVSDKYDNEFFDERDNYAFNRQIKSRLWYWIHGFMISDNLTSMETDESDTIKTFLAHCESELLPDEIIKFLLNPTIGSCGIYQNVPTNSPIIVTSLPPGYLLKHSKEMWERRASKMSPKPKKPSQFDDFHQDRCEKAFYNGLQDHSIHKALFFDKNVKSGHDDKAANDFGFTFSSDQGKDANTSSGFKSTSGGLVVPDDSTYIPDGLLASRSTSYTALVKSKPASELFHDHMKRFGISDEAPRTISWDQLILGKPDSDFTIDTRIRGNRNHYMVTYSRMSRKPIFNPITGAR